MDITSNPLVALNSRRHLPTISLPALAGLISALLILNGLIFRTYTITMPSAPMEVARQLGITSVLAELAVILYAMRRGLNFTEIWKAIPRYLRYGLLFFFSWFWIGSVFYSQMPQFAVVQNIIFVVHLLFAVAIYHSVSHVDTSGMQKLATLLAIGMVIFCGMIALAFINHPPLENMPNNEIVWQFIIPGFISVRLFGAFCGAIFCYLLVQLLLGEEKQDRQYLPYIWLTVCAAMTIWSGTRNAVLGIVIVMTLMTFVYKVRPAGLMSVILLVISLVTASWLAITFIPYNDEMFKLISNGDSISAESISGTRASYWTALWEEYKTIPLFGAGPFASFWILPPGEQIHVQPHNIMLQFLLSWGLPATVVAIALLGYTTWKAHLIAWEHRAILPFLAMLDCLLAMSFFDGMFHFAQPLMLIMISFGVIFSINKTHEVSRSG